MVVSLVLLTVLAVDVGQRLQAAVRHVERHPGRRAAGFAVVMGIVMALLPALGELSTNVADYGEHGDRDAAAADRPVGQDRLPRVRRRPPVLVPGATRVGAQLLLWGVLAVGFAPLADRVLRSDEPAGPRRRPVNACGRLDG